MFLKLATLGPLVPLPRVGVEWQLQPRYRKPEFVKEDFFKNQATLSECEVNRWSFKNKLACPSPKETSGHAPA